MNMNDSVTLNLFFSVVYFFSVAWFYGYLLKYYTENYPLQKTVYFVCLVGTVFMFFFNFFFFFEKEKQNIRNKVVQEMKANIDGIYVKSEK